MNSSPNNMGGLERPSASPNANILTDVVATSEIQKWMSYIEQQLNEIHNTALDSKLNSEQKMRVSNICRKIGHGAFQMAVLYQSLKQKALQASDTIEELHEKCKLTEHLSGLEQTIQQSCNAEKSSYADMIKKESNSFIRSKNVSSIAIYPSDVLKTSDETKNMVKMLIKPEELKLQVRAVRKVKNGGVIISTESKKDTDKIKETVKLCAPGFTAAEPAKRNPRVVVIGVPASLKEKEVFRCLFEQNIADKFPSLTLESFLTSIRLSHKSGRKDSPSCNYIIEVPANIRKALITQSRLFINWTSCPVRDFTLVTRCYKCQQYGHAAKFCKEDDSTCGHCAGAGHSMTECPKKSESPKCATCSRYKKPSNHKTGETDCPARKQAEFRYMNSINYEV